MPYPLEFLRDGSVTDTNFQRLAQDMNPPVPQARVYNSAALTITNNTATVVTFDSERFDSGGLHSTTANTGRLTAPISGLYHFGVSIEWPANVAGIRQILLRLNGATFVAADIRSAAAAGGIEHTVSTVYQLAATDYIETVVVQTSGGNLNVNAAANYSPEFWMYRVGGYINQGV
jgi:hypothetical protein